MRAGHLLSLTVCSSFSVSGLLPNLPTAAAPIGLCFVAGRRLCFLPCRHPSHSGRCTVGGGIGLSPKLGQAVRESCHSRLASARNLASHLHYSLHSLSTSEEALSLPLVPSSPALPHLQLPPLFACISRSLFCAAGAVASVQSCSCPFFLIRAVCVKTPGFLANGWAQ